MASSTENRFVEFGLWRAAHGYIGYVDEWSVVDRIPLKGIPARLPGAMYDESLSIAGLLGEIDILDLMAGVTVYAKVVGKPHGIVQVSIAQFSIDTGSVAVCAGAKVFRCLLL